MIHRNELLLTASSAPRSAIIRFILDYGVAKDSRGKEFVTVVHGIGFVEVRKIRSNLNHLTGWFVSSGIVRLATAQSSSCGTHSIEFSPSLSSLIDTV